jgi:hypothetical protein
MPKVALQALQAVQLKARELCSTYNDEHLRLLVRDRPAVVSVCKLDGDAVSRELVRHVLHTHVSV